MLWYEGTGSNQTIDLGLVKFVVFDQSVKPKSFQYEVVIVLGRTDLQETETVVAAFGDSTAFDLIFVAVYQPVMIFVERAAYRMPPRFKYSLRYLFKSFAFGLGRQSL